MTCPYMPAFVTRPIYLASLLMLSGCASMQLNNLFKDYASQMQPVRKAVVAGDIASATKQVPSTSITDTNYQLTLLEQGRLAFLQGDYQQSKWWFKQGYQALEQEREAAKLQLGKGVEKVNTLVTNDNAIRYQMPAYEQSMMHGYQALNYAFSGDVEGALVEVRRANLVQERALANHQTDLEQAYMQDNTQGNSIDFDALNKAMAGLDARIGELKNGFQNAYTFYLSGVLYEASGQLNDAYIDYKKALEISPDNTYLQRDVLRLGSALGMDNDLELFKARFAQSIKPMSSDDGQLVVIYEQQLIDAKDEQSLRLPIWTSRGDMRFYSFAIPSYSARTYHQPPLVLSISDEQNQTFQSQTLVQLQALVAKNLKDSMLSMIGRQVLRVVAKEQVRRKLSREGGDVGNILAGIYNMASERADTRSWLTLPGDVQLTRTVLPQGQHQLELASNQGGAFIDDQLSVEVVSGRITLLMISQVGQLNQIKQVVL